MNLCFLFSGEVKEFGSTLVVRGLKERTQSLSNVNILISPCDPDQRPSHSRPASPQCDTSDAHVEKPAEKSRLEAAVSFPLERSMVTQYSSSLTLSSSPSSNRKSVSSIIYSPSHQDQEGATSLIHPGSEQVFRPDQWGVHPSPTASVEKSKDDETKQEAEERMSRPSDGERRRETVDSHHGNRQGEEPSEELLVGEDRMYPTLRSKSLNANPRKTRAKKEGEATPRSAGSVTDLVSAFSGSTGGPRSRTRFRDSDC